MVYIILSLKLISILFLHSYFFISAEEIYPLMGNENMMLTKAHGTCISGVNRKLRWGCDKDVADRISCYNRHYAEYAGYWETTKFLTEISNNEEITFYDSVTGKPLFVAPRGRSWNNFISESRKHGWPSFRDEEVIWENVRILPSGESISVDGTHLGHNLPDKKGNRYCINIVSIAGVDSISQEL